MGCTMLIGAVSEDVYQGCQRSDGFLCVNMRSQLFARLADPCGSLPESNVVIRGEGSRPPSGSSVRITVGNSSVWLALQAMHSISRVHWCPCLDRFLLAIPCCLSCDIAALRELTECIRIGDPSSFCWTPSGSGTQHSVTSESATSLGELVQGLAQRFGPTALRNRMWRTARLLAGEHSAGEVRPSPATARDLLAPPPVQPRCISEGRPGLIPAGVSVPDGGWWAAPRGARWSSNRRSRGSESPTAAHRAVTPTGPCLRLALSTTCPMRHSKTPTGSSSGCSGPTTTVSGSTCVVIVFTEIPRSESVLSAAALNYEDVTCLYADPPDALIVTGLEPRLTDLADEPYWEDLAHLLRWAQATVPSTILSCLASHAAALALDGISRHPLPSKQSGVYGQEVDPDHPLGAGLERVVSLPHSRYNDIPAATLNARYRLVVASALSGWSVATRQSEGRVLVLLQGHPEYGRLTLLKEYRRDVRRFFEGVLPAHPAIPLDYLDATGIELLESFRTRCESRSGAPLDAFPYEEAAKHVDFRWEHTSKRLFANWIEDAAKRSTPATS